MRNIGKKNIFCLISFFCDRRFFTKQFDGLRLDRSSVLDGRVDSITGATLSVRAVTHVARLALLLAQQVVPEKAAS